MTRRVVYGVSLWIFLGTTALTLAAIIIPEWIVWDTIAPTPSNDIHYSYGLHHQCSSTDQSCTPFPRYEDCQGPNRKFCSLWRTCGFLMTAAVFAEFAAFVAFAIVLLGGKQKRQSGWKLIFAVLSLTVGFQVGAMGIVAGLRNDDDRFFDGWYLGKSFILATVSWAIQTIVAVGIVVSAFMLEEEGGYELIPDRDRGNPWR